MLGGSDKGQVQCNEQILKKNIIAFEKRKADLAKKQAALAEQERILAEQQRQFEQERRMMEQQLADIDDLISCDELLIATEEASLNTQAQHNDDLAQQQELKEKQLKVNLLTLDEERQKFAKLQKDKQVVDKNLPAKPDLDSQPNITKCKNALIAGRHFLPIQQVELVKLKDEFAVKQQREGVKYEPKQPVKALLELSPRCYCPISLEPMEKPVLCILDNTVYDFKNIKDFILQHNGQVPMSHKKVRLDQKQIPEEVLEENELTHGIKEELALFKALEQENRHKP